METLLNGQSITVNFDEQIVYSQLDENESAIWSLLTASGYLKIENIEYKGNFFGTLVYASYYQSGDSRHVFCYVSWMVFQFGCQLQWIL